MDQYALAELEALPTLSQGQTCNLKIQTGNTRVWLSRCGVDDGMPWDNQVTHEELQGGSWVVTREYPARVEA